MALKDEIGTRIKERVRTTVDPRLGITYAAVRTRRDEDDERLFESPPAWMHWHVHLTIREAATYWGPSELGALNRHLEEPAPRHSKIAGWNDDAWIATEDHEIILHMDGLD